MEKGQALSHIGKAHPGGGGAGVKAHAVIGDFQDHRGSLRVVRRKMRPEPDMDGLIVAGHPVDHAVFYQRLYQQLGHVDLSGAGLHLYLVFDAVIKAELLQLQVLNDKVRFLSHRGGVAVAANVAEQLGKVPDTLLQKLPLSHAVEHDEAIQDVIQKMGVDLGLQGQVFSTETSCPGLRLPVDELIQLLTRLIEGVRDPFEFLIIFYLALVAQIAFLKLLNGIQEESRAAIVLAERWR